MRQMMNIIRQEKEHSAKSPVVQMYPNYNPDVTQLFEPYSSEQLEYFFERAIEEEEYEMCKVIKMVLDRGSYHYNPAA